MTDENTSASDLCACDSSHAGQGWLPGRDGLTTGCKQERLRPRVPDLGRSRWDSPAWCLWVPQSSHAPWVTCLSARIESAQSASACARVLWIGAFLDSPLQHGQFRHLRITSWSLPGARDTAQCPVTEGGSEPKLAASAGSTQGRRLPRSHPAPASGCGLSQDGRHGL